MLVYYVLDTEVVDVYFEDIHIRFQHYSIILQQYLAQQKNNLCF